MTPAELRVSVATTGLYKMSLGKSARYRKEALDRGVLVFQSEAAFHQAVLTGDDAQIRRTGRLIKSDVHPRADAPDSAISVWRRTIETFRSLPRHTLVLHWEGDFDHLHWGLTGDRFSLERDEMDEWGQPGLVFHRPLAGGWRKASIGGVPLSNMHPRARDLAINMATLNRVQTDPGYFRALIGDADTSEWEARADWVEKARSKGWLPKDRAALLAVRREARSTPLVREVADFFEEEARRMASTALRTAAYANGQTVLTTVKDKEIRFTRDELEEEIAALLRIQKNRCALTGYAFQKEPANPHLRPSLDRKDSGLGYVPGNLQVVTRAANFFKSASDDDDWKLKAQAMEKMAAAMQRARKEAEAAQPRPE